MKSGQFIVLEGGEGTGKTTQVRLLAGRLAGLGISVVETREPGGTPFAESARRILLNSAIEASGPEAEAILVNAGRLDHLHGLIVPALSSGAWVLCDRFTASTRVYQGIVANADLDFVDAVNARATRIARPDLTIVIDQPADVSLERVRRRAAGQSATGDRWDAGTLDDYERLRTAFLEIAAASPHDHAVVDGARCTETVAEAIWRHVLELIPGGADAA